MNPFSRVVCSALCRSQVRAIGSALEAETIRRSANRLSRVSSTNARSRGHGEGGMSKITASIPLPVSTRTVTEQILQLLVRT